MNQHSTTIVAPASIPGSGAISVIRLSGPKALEIADKVISCRKGDISSAKGYTIKFGTVYGRDANSCGAGEGGGTANSCGAGEGGRTANSCGAGEGGDEVEGGGTANSCGAGEDGREVEGGGTANSCGAGDGGDEAARKQCVIDEVLVSVFRAPHSYTGEDSVEISCHASRYIVETIIHLLIEAGAEPARPGEFTERAFLNGKMDLAQAEAVADLIASESAASHRIAMNQMKGHFSDELRSMREEMLKIVSLMELELDFSEEEVEFADRTTLTTLLRKTKDHCDRLSSSFRQGNAIKNGIPVAIIGPTNAGKSTLLNNLLGEERAIVSDIAGTTRDTIEEVINIDGVQLRFIDTAGIRDTQETIERIGIERTLKTAAEAMVVLAVSDISEDETSLVEHLNSLTSLLSTGQKALILLNKCDKLSDNVVNNIVTKVNKIVSFPVIQISAQNGLGIDSLKDQLGKIASEIIGNTDENLVTNIRHARELNETSLSLGRALDGLSSDLPTDLVAQDIREAIYHLGSIVGLISTDEVLGNIFRNFCIGK
ncbi:MAG: tRNA uridine-5-carboxymethylaminomethyl(34) synthesis GTPase MnmE [Bacteroidales bacterium]|nr:tRNA uridine-5-carboxymethylaminomethyl(34) synthesis GTPase MnmE [Bacteroidales bacterium]